MHFAFPLPFWLIVLIAAGIGAIAYLSYRRPYVSLSGGQRGSLMLLRAFALALVATLLCRPVFVLPPRARDAVLPVLVDASQSMRVADVGGRTRIEAATAVLKADLLPALSKQFMPELYTFGEAVTPASLEELHADAQRSEIASALATIRERYRGRRISGVVLLSDGGDTGQYATELAHATDLPVYAVGIGNATGLKDREIVAMDAGDPRVDNSTVDLRVSAAARGYGRSPLDVQLKANGVAIETRRLQPAADGVPVEAWFTVSPDPDTPTVYSAEVAASDDELVSGNNGRIVLVSPPGRKRQILAIEGAPGYEHSFLNRALSEDSALELDAVVRKGKNDAGQETFFVQAAGGRAAALAQGLPAAKEALFAYDAVVIANVEGEFFSRAQLDTLASFVGDRGGGLLVLGARSFAQRGFLSTPLEPVLPVDLSDRRGGVSRAALSDELPASQYALALTSDGESHPVLRMGADVDATRKRWAALPPLAGVSPLGAARPGATILAVANAPGGVLPLVAVQRYGRGRSMAFAGEASWRWRMMMPSTDHTYEFFWRQALRWLSTPAPDRLTITAPDDAEPGDALTIDVEVRDPAFAPIADASVTASLTSPDGTASTLVPRKMPNAAGRFSIAWRPESRGLYRIQVATDHGMTANRWLFVGGGHRELADPRLNEGVLTRLAQASGGQYVPLSDAARVAQWLEGAVPADQEPETRDAWQTPWMFALVVTLISTEWVLRRRWGLR